MKNTLKVLKKIVYLIIDGMTETEEVNSTLLLARTPIINGLISKQSILGFYDPIVGPGDKEPKTDVVIPHFFGLPAQYNPGRTVLELIDQGVQIKPAMYCAEIKVRFRSQAQEDNWVKLKKIPDGLAHKLEKELSTYLGRGRNFILSEATESGARILFYFDDLDLLNRAICTTGDICQKYKLIAIEGVRNKVGEEVLSFRNSKRRALFIGWAKGSLRGAFKLCGLDINEFSRKRGDFYNWSSYYKNFNEWGIPILKTNPLHERYVLYTKESAFAARKGDKLKKREAIEFMDTMLGKFLAVFPEKLFTVVVLSDHSADLGGITNPSKNTCFAILRGSYNTIKKNSFNFSESLIASTQKGVYSQQEVMDMIEQVE